MAGKKKSEETGLKELKGDLARGALRNLYVFHGEETYLRDHYLKQMKEKALTGGLDDFNYHVLPAKDFSLRRLQELVDAMPMMSERTFVLVSDYDIYKEDRDGMAALLSDLPDYVCLVFLYDVVEYKPDNRSKLAKLVKENGLVVNFVRPDQGDLTDWIARRFGALGHDISTADAQYLIFRCGDLMTGLIPEIGKIGTYASARRVTRQDIDAVATPQLDARVFDLTDAIAAGDFDGAFAVLVDLLQMQEEPIMILSLLGRQLRQLYTARLAFEHQKGTKWLMELWGMRSAFPAEKLMKAARRFSLPWCRRAVLRCEETDLAMKSSGGDRKDLLVNLLLELAQGKTA